MALDRRLERWVVEHRVDALDPIFVALSRVGTYGFVWLVLALVAAIAWRRPSIFAWVLAATTSSDLLALAFKGLTGRPRPSVTFPEPEPLVTTPLDLSFPSGHAATSFAAAVVFTRYRPRAAPAAFAVAAAIAWSRVYVGVHYPLDVVAGALVGAVVATALLRLEEALPRSPRARRRG